MTITSRIDAITEIPAAYRVPDTPCPPSVKIELTGRCNFNCVFCARSMRLRDQQEMSRPLFERLLVEMRGAGVEEIGLFYLGESLMVEWLPEAVRFAKEEAGFPYVFLTTNGSLCTPEKTGQLMEAGLDSLKFSFNYADEAQFREIARVKPKLFEAMLANIKAARGVRDAGGYGCGLYASYIEYDGDQGARMNALVDDIYPYMDEVYALPLYSQAGLCTDDEAGKGWAPTAGVMGRSGNMREPLPCWACFREGHITWDGKLSACCFDHDGRFHMGDLTKESFMDAWQSQPFQELRAAHLAKDVRGTVCGDCVAWS